MRWDALDFLTQRSKYKRPTSDGICRPFPIATAFHLIIDRHQPHINKRTLTSATLNHVVLSHDANVHPPQARSPVGTYLHPCPSCFIPPSHQVTPTSALATSLQPPLDKIYIYYLPVRVADMLQGDLATFEPLLATPELIMSASNASFESLEPSTPTSQRTFSTNVLPPPTPRFTRTQTPMTKTVVPPSPSPIARVRSTIPRTSSSYPTVPVTPLKTSRAPASAPPATPIHQQRVGPPRTPHTPSPATAACTVPGVFLDPFYDGPSSSMSWSPSSKELPFRATPFARASVQR